MVQEAAGAGCFLKIGIPNCRAPEHGTIVFVFMDMAPTSTVQTMGPAYGPLIWNPYIPSMYHVGARGPYFKPHQPQQGRKGRGPNQRPLLQALHYSPKSLYRVYVLSAYE